jgi:hypothetical protein
LPSPANLDDHALDSVAALESLVRDPLGTGHDRLGIAEVENRVAVVHLLDDAGDEVALAALVDVEDLLALRLSQALGDDLLRGLSGDPSEVVRGVLPLTGDVAVLVEFLGVDTDVATVGVDGDPRLFGSPGAALVGTHQGIGEGIEDGVDRYAPLPLQELEGLHHLKVDLHLRLLTSSPVWGRPAI